jgi:hypothetical protein
MGFVNEVISQEDIEKYELMKIYDKHHKNKKVYEFKTVAKTFYQWTIDKENEIFLIHFGRFFADEQPDHGVLYTNENIFIFYYEKKFYEIILIRERENRIMNDMGNKKLFYETTWGFKSISPNINMDNNFKDTLKKALIVKGENGTYDEEYTKYIIDFTF